MAYNSVLVDRIFQGIKDDKRSIENVRMCLCNNCIEVVRRLNK